jgi:hypothetical protein
LPVKVVWLHYKTTYAKLGEEAAKLLAVMEDFSREEPDFVIEVM